MRKVIPGQARSSRRRRKTKLLIDLFIFFSLCENTRGEKRSPRNIDDDRREKRKGTNRSWGWGGMDTYVGTIIKPRKKNQEVKEREKKKASDGK